MKSSTKVVEIEELEFFDFSWRLSDTEIYETVKKWKENRYEPRKVLAIYRGKNRV